MPSNQQLQPSAGESSALDFHPCRNLSIAAAAQAAAYAAIPLFFSVVGVSDHIVIRQLFIWPVLFTLTGFYWRSFRIVQSDKSVSLGLILGYAAVFALLAFWTPPFHSTDLFDYVNYGWLQSHYHMNPYANAVSDIPGWERDPMITETFWRDTPCAYGFLFELLARLLCAIGRGNLKLTLAVFKATSVAALSTTAWLVFVCTRRLQLPSAPALCLLLWNPLILLDCVANGHNDILVALSMVAAIYFVISSRWILVIPVLVTGTLLKYPCAVILPSLW
jgi:hypothetical protein